MNIVSYVTGTLGMQEKNGNAHLGKDSHGPCH